MDFVLAKLKLRAFELFRRFDEAVRGELLATVDELMHADGRVHPSEAKFRAELAALLEEPVELDDTDLEPLEEGSVVIHDVKQLLPREFDHPFLQRFEWKSPRRATTSRA